MKTGTTEIYQWGTTLPYTTLFRSVGGYEIPVTCYIEGQKSIAFQDLTTGTADNRLFAVGLNLTVVAELPILAYMQQTTGTITVKAKILEE